VRAVYTAIFAHVLSPRHAGIFDIQPAKHFGLKDDSAVGMARWPVYDICKNTLIAALLKHSGCYFLCRSAARNLLRHDQLACHRTMG